MIHLLSTLEKLTVRFVRLEIPSSSHCTQKCMKNTRKRTSIDPVNGVGLSGENQFPFVLSRKIQEKF